jgi:hypothetical protein
MVDLWQEEEQPIMCRYITVHGNAVSRRWTLLVVGFQNERDGQRCQAIFPEVY